MLALAGALLAGAIAFVFVGALGQADDVSRMAERLREENAELERRVEAGYSEIELIASDLFLRLQARAYGKGEVGERPFALADGTPTPAPLPLLGAGVERRPVTTPLEAWLDLLF